MKESLSAWMDDELNPEQSAAMLGQLKHDAGLRGNWDCYHLIGDSMRGIHGPDLCAALRARIASEPTVLAPKRRGKLENLRGAALSLAAGVAAVSFVGWIALSGSPSEIVQIATISATPAIQPVVAVQAGDAVNDYLLAHQRYSPSNAMQGVAPYVRTVAEERNSAIR